MASTLQRAAIEVHKSMTQSQVQRLGTHSEFFMRAQLLIGDKSVLVDEDASKTGDLYIRSVCFSPDGKYLATGAEDKQIRVSINCREFVLVAAPLEAFSLITDRHAY